MKYKELLVIYILEILLEHASKDKKIYQKDILDILYRDYNIEINSDTLGKYIKILREDGYIEGRRGIYRVNKFSDSEIRMLIDSILYAQYISAKEAKELIEKLKELSPISLKNKIRHIHYVEKLNRTKNDRLYPILDKLDEAIEKNRRVKVTICRYNEEAILEDVRKEVIHPYYIVNSNSRYYVICYAARGTNLESRRIDSISNVEILEEKIIPLENIIGKGRRFDLGQYMEENIYMFTGEVRPIEIKLLKYHIGYFIDWFGTDYRIIEREDDYLTLRVINNDNAVYYWALQYGDLIEIVKPLDLRERIKEGLENILEKYK